MRAEANVSGDWSALGLAGGTAAQQGTDAINPPSTDTARARETRLQNRCKNRNEPVRFFGNFRFPPVRISRSFYIRFPKITLQIAFGIRRESSQAYNVLSINELERPPFRRFGI